MSIRDSLDKLKAETPNQFTVTLAGTPAKAETEITYDRTWSNGWGLTAYARAWWNDAPVTPGRKFDGEVGIKGRLQF